MSEAEPVRPPPPERVDTVVEQQGQPEGGSAHAGLPGVPAEDAAPEPEADPKQQAKEDKKAAQRATKLAKKEEAAAKKAAKQAAKKNKKNSDPPAEPESEPEPELQPEPAMPPSPSPVPAPEPAPAQSQEPGPQAPRATVNPLASRAPAMGSSPPVQPAQVPMSAAPSTQPAAPLAGARPAHAVQPGLAQPAGHESPALPGARSDGCVARWLDKKSSAKTNLVKGGGWQRRWFVFDPAGKIRYMESPDEQNPHVKDMSQIVRLTSNNYASGHFELHWLNGDKRMQLRVPDKQPATLHEVQRMFLALHKLGLLVRSNAPGSYYMRFAFVA